MLRVWHGAAENGGRKPFQRRIPKPFVAYVCTCEYALHSCRGKSAGVAKRPRELIIISHPEKGFRRIRFASLYHQGAYLFRVRVGGKCLLQDAARASDVSVHTIDN